jgi:KUP system potassium uptake protein
VSLIFWGLTMIVSLKYVTLVLRADNRGEGGIMALMALALNSDQGLALALPADGDRRVRRHHVLRRQRDHAGHFGAGAIEGLEVATPACRKIRGAADHHRAGGLYSVQRHGTAGIGRWFGPMMIVWFATLAVMGVINIVQAPVILLAALNPLHAFALHAGEPLHRLRRAGRGGAGLHRRRGAVCRHGPLRQEADPLAWFWSCSRRWR